VSGPLDNDTQHGQFGRRWVRKVIGHVAERRFPGRFLRSTFRMSHKRHSIPTRPVAVTTYIVAFRSAKGMRAESFAKGMPTMRRAHEMSLASTKSRGFRGYGLGRDFLLISRANDLKSPSAHELVFVLSDPFVTRHTLSFSLFPTCRSTLPSPNTKENKP